MTKEIILYTGISYLGNMRVVEISPLDKAVKVKVAGKDKLTYYFKKGDKFIYASLAGDTAEVTHKDIYFFQTRDEFIKECDKNGKEYKFEKDNFLAEVISFENNKLVLCCDYFLVDILDNSFEKQHFKNREDFIVYK